MSHLQVWLFLIFFLLIVLFSLNILLLIGYQIFLAISRHFSPGDRPQPTEHEPYDL